MAKRSVYEVKKTGDDWTVKQRGAQRAVGNFDSKTEAVERAREVGRNNGHAQVVIRRENGSIQTEHTYGDDPYPPKG